MFLALNLGSRLLTAIVCGAIAVLVFSQIRKDGKSRSFAALMIIIAGYAFCGTLTRFIGILGSDVTLTFNIAVSLTTAAGMYMIAFSAEYFNAWTRWRRWAFY